MKYYFVISLCLLFLYHLFEIIKILKARKRNLVDDAQVASKGIAFYAVSCVIIMLFIVKACWFMEW